MDGILKRGRKSIKQETNRSNIHLTISINVKPYMAHQITILLV